MLFKVWLNFFNCCHMINTVILNTSAIVICCDCCIFFSPRHKSCIVARSKSMSATRICHFMLWWQLIFTCFHWMEIEIDAQSTDSSCKSNWKKVIVDQSQSITMDLHKHVMTLSHIYHTRYRLEKWLTKREQQQVKN